MYEDDADGFLSESRTRLVSLVRELIDRIPGSAPAAPEEQPAEVETEIVAEADEATTLGRRQRSCVASFVAAAERKCEAGGGNRTRVTSLEG